MGDRGFARQRRILGLRVKCERRPRRTSPARGDFIQALDVLFKGQLWEDAAFVAERVLTANELKQYVDALPKTEAPKEGEDFNKKLRYLLGRRLVREDRYAEAKQYLRRRTTESWKGM